MRKIIPDCWKQASKPHLFCPGCGHAMALKQLGFAIDDLEIGSKLVFGIDIGCSLLAWDFFNLDTVQTHHGRTVPVMVGYKMAKPNRVALAYMGDGGAYAIGLQSLLHAAYRNSPITVIVINNENYAMTGGQMSPTTEIGIKTSTSPTGKDRAFGPGLKGSELVREISDTKAYIARASVANPIDLKLKLKKAINHQILNDSFSMVEVLSVCPINWKTDAKESFERNREMAKYYPLGEII